MASQSGNLRTSSRLRSIWTVTSRSGATDGFRQYHVVASRNSAKLPQLGLRIGCSVLGSAPSLLDRVLFARGKVGLNTVVRTLCNPSWPQRTLSTVSSPMLVPCFSRISSHVNCARFERLTYDLQEYRLKNMFQLLNDTVRHLVFTTREHEDVVVIMEMLNGQSRTPDEQQFHLVLVEIDTNVKDWLAQNTLINCTHIATATRTSVATIQQSASTQNPSCESLE